MWFLRNIGIVVDTIFYAILSTFTQLLFKDPSAFYRQARDWSRILLWFGGVKVEVIGAEHLTPGERVVFVSNHASQMDIPILLGWIPDNARIMYKMELQRIPLFGWCMRHSPYIPVDRGDGRQAAEQLERTIDSMRTGASVIVFPEGTRSPDGTLQEFKRGGFLLAARAGKRIVPVTIVGSHKILPPDSLRPRTGHVKLIIDPPITLPDPPSRKDEVDAMARVQEIIGARLRNQ
jgi:1-acyl-sn-glycerol-3-phosphate acyltransferase